MDYSERVKIANVIEKEVEEALDLYYQFGEIEKEYYIIYPLMFLEEYFASQTSGNITGMVEVKLASWLIGEMIKRGAEYDLSPNFNEESYQYYKNEIISGLRVLYLKKDTLDEIKDTYCISSAKIIKENTDYKISKAFPVDKYNKEEVYYDQIFDVEKFEEDKITIRKSTEMVLEKFVTSKKHPTYTLHDLVKNLDIKYYEACKDRVAIDLNEWLGRNIKSNIVGSRKELVSIVGYFYYLGMAYHTRSSLSGDRNFIFAFRKSDLIKKIRVATSLSVGKIEKYLDYFTFEGSGTLNNFPFIQSDNMIGFIPSSMILNDWQFSITAGHYTKKIQFKNRDKSISRNVIELINHSLIPIENIEVANEHQYKLVTKEGTSDIDIALYCEEQKSLLIIEAKWIDNHYKGNDDEKFSNIYSTLNEIYSKQLSKHEFYLSEAEKGLSKLYEKPIEVERVEYIAVDKRSQLHLEDKHLLSVYVLVFLIRKYTKDSKLDLNNLMDEIMSLRTEVDYYDLVSVSL